MAANERNGASNGASNGALKVEPRSKLAFLLAIWSGGSAMFVYFLCYLLSKEEDKIAFNKTL